MISSAVLTHHVLDVLQLLDLAYQGIMISGTIVHSGDGPGQPERP